MINLTDEQIDGIAELVQTIRRQRNHDLMTALNGDKYIYNLEDAGKLIGELNALYNHLCSIKASDEVNIYCALKHAFTAYVLSNEVDGNCKEIMDIIEALTDGQIKACQSCKDDEEALTNDSEVEHKLI